MAQVSAGILLFRISNGGIEVFIVHPGGPYFQNKDKGAWSIPKGLPHKEETLLQAAFREFEEETGISLKDNTPEPLGHIKQKGGKEVHAWAVLQELSTPVAIKSNSFEIEWPPHSGQHQSFPEIDRAEFFTLEKAKEKINPAQVAFIEALEKSIKQHSHD